jgi:hypothetical protein
MSSSDEGGVVTLPDTFTSHQGAARALIASGYDIGRRAGQFAGGLIFEPGPLTEPQVRWLQGLLRRAGLPPLEVS